MIRYIRHSEIDKAKWDHAISHSHNRLPYALSWFLDVVSPGWDALVMDDYKEVMPLAHRQRMGISYICQPLLCPRLGVFSTIRNDVFPIDEYLRFIPKKFRLIDMAVNEMNKINMNGAALVKKRKVYQELHTQHDYSVLQGNYSKSHLRNMKRFTKDAFPVSSRFTYKDFHRLKMQFVRKAGIRLTRQNEKQHLLLLEELASRQKLDIRVAFSKAEILGGICLIRSDFGRISIQSFMTQAGKKTGVIFYLIDQLIRENAGKDVRIDFMGSSLPGVRRRNLGFGSEQVNYDFIRIYRLTGFLRYLKKDRMD